MATIKSTLAFEDKMSAKIRGVSEALERASDAADVAAQDMQNMARTFGATSKEATSATVAWAKAKNTANELSAQLDALTKEQERLAHEERQAALEAAFATQKTSVFGVEINKTKKEIDEMDDKLGNTSNGLSMFGVSLGTVIGNVATRALDALKNSIGQAIESASDLAEVQNVVDVAFGENSTAIDQWSQTTLKQFGLNELSAKQFAGTMGAMLKSSGLTGDAVAGMSMKIAELAGDMASFYNLDPTEAFTKLRSGISGETEPLKQLGINMSVANLEAFAMSKGIKESYKDMSQAAQMTLRYQYLLGATSDAQGDFARTSESFANQQKLASENWLRLSSAIANMFIPALTAGYSMLNNLMNFLADNLTTIVPILTATLGAVTIAFVAMKWEAIEAGIASVTAAMESLGAWIAATAPIWIVVGVIGAVSIAMNALGLTFQQQAENIVISLNWVITALKNIWIAMQNTWIGATNFVRNFANNSMLILANFFSWVLSKLSGIAKLMDTVLHTDLSGSVASISAATDKVKSNLSAKIAGNTTPYKSFEANDYYTNQAKAQKFMGGASNAVASIGSALKNLGINEDSIGGGGKGGGGLGKGLTTNTPGGKALKTQNQGDIKIAQEDIKLLHDIATRDYSVNYQQLTPQVTLQGLTINEMVDANQVVDMIVDGISEAADSKLEVVS